MLEFHDVQKDLVISRSQVLSLFTFLLEHYQVRANSLSVTFLPQDQMCQLHALYFGDASPTDCMTFPLDPPDQEGGVLGDVYICPKIAIESCQEFQEYTPHQELSLYCIHTFLHLLGYEDQTQEQRKKMREKEKEVMTLLQEHDRLLRP